MRPSSTDRTLLPYLILSVLAMTLLMSSCSEETGVMVFPGANSRESYFSIHNIRAVHAVTKGEGVKVGILDHSFGIDERPDFYAGGESFQTGDWAAGYRTESHHGSWMAMVLKELAPEVEVYALGTYSGDEGERVDAMARAIDWAVEHELDAITYSARAFSDEGKAVLDPAVDRAIAAGVAVIFIHYPHPDNILPSWIGPMSGDDEREPDLNIFHFDYSVVFPDMYQAYMAGEETNRGYQPFLSISSTAPVTAAMVAFLKSLDPTLTPAQCKEILRETSRPLTFEGHEGIRVPDAFEAVKRVTETTY